jgi:DNA-binding NtrC family response regulator
MAKVTDERSPYTIRVSLPGDAPAWPTPRAIRIVRPGQREFVVPLLTERHYQLGRAETVDLYFEDESVSRFHGFLYYDAMFGAWAYRDAGSTFGSALADPTGRGRSEPIPPRQPTAVLAGHIVALGTRGSRVELLEDVPPEALATSGAAAWKSEAARALEERVQVASNHSLPLLLLGASGSGKTYVADRIHRLSRRRGRFVGINCTHLPADPTALRSELVGHVKGAFTGAVEAKTGQLFLADEGTLFLDEVESLGRDAQAFLLTLLEGSEDLVPLGAPASKGRPRPSFRLISASKQRLNESPLRHDLAQRLGAGDFIHVPSLEERRQDIPTLAHRFVEELAAEQQVDCELTPDALAYLMEQKWPGQIRELRATVKATAVRSWWRANSASGTDRRRVLVGVAELQSYLAERSNAFGSTVGVPLRTADPPEPAPGPAPHRKRPADLTREDLESALRLADGNKTRTAQALGISPTTLRKKMEELGL